MIYILYILLICNILDVILTRELLAIGYIELNPIANYIIINFGYITLGILKCIPIIYLMFVREMNIQYGTVIIVIITFAFILLNIHQIFTLFF